MWRKGVTLRARRSRNPFRLNATSHFGSSWSAVGRVALSPPPLTRHPFLHDTRCTCTFPRRESSGIPMSWEAMPKMRLVAKAPWTLCWMLLCILAYTTTIQRPRTGANSTRCCYDRGPPAWRARGKTIAATVHLPAPHGDHSPRAPHSVSKAPRRAAPVGDDELEEHPWLAQFQHTPASSTTPSGQRQGAASSSSRPRESSERVLRVQRDAGSLGNRHSKERGRFQDDPAWWGVDFPTQGSGSWHCHGLLCNRLGSSVDLRILSSEDGFIQHPPLPRQGNPHGFGVVRQAPILLRHLALSRLRAVWLHRCRPWGL